MTSILRHEDAVEETGSDVAELHIVDEYAPPEEWSFEEDEPRTSGLARAAGVIALLAAAGWMGLAAYIQFLAPGAQPVDAASAIAFIATVSAPLALIGVAWLLAMRSSTAEQRRFAQTAAGLQREGERLEALLARVSGRIDSSRIALADQGSQLMSLGEDAAGRLNAVREALETEIEAVNRQVHSLKGAAAVARGDLSVLMSNLPKAQVQTRQMVASLQEAGLTASEKAEALTAQLAALSARGREADEIAGNSAEKLAAQLARMEGLSEAASQRLTEAAESMSQSVDAALDRAATALAAAREGMEAQGSAMNALVETSQAALARTGSEATAAIEARLAEVSRAIEQAGDALERHKSSSSALFAQVEGGVAQTDARFAELGTTSSERIERLSSAISALSGHAAELRTALDGNGDAANTLVTRTESLITALEAASREMDETLPAAFERLDTRSARSLEGAQAAGPAILSLVSATDALQTQLERIDASLDRQRDVLAALEALSEERLTRDSQLISEIGEALANARADAALLADEAAPRLAQALADAQAASQKTMEESRAALSSLIPDAAREMGEHARDALNEALGDEIDRQMTQIAGAAGDAVESARTAARALERQIQAIEKSTETIEQRFGDLRAEAERRERESFSRRAALLIETLNSTAIDVSRILSNEVTDAAWAAYLKGDRGIFTRRAVRLLNSGEAREILTHYEGDAEFREQVNRYVHDFEALLRGALAQRDSTPLGVTLLSSELGRLYVALAQAIERLRR